MGMQGIINSLPTKGADDMMDVARSLAGSFQELSVSVGERISKLAAMLREYDRREYGGGASRSGQNWGDRAGGTAPQG